jgi:hypothetical protein
MTAQIFNMRDYQSKPDKRDLEKQALEILNQALMGNDAVIYESSLGWIDTAPSEYVAPDKDSA